MATKARIARRRQQFRDGMSVREFARTIKGRELEDPEYWGTTHNLMTAARNDNTGRWGRH